MPKAISLKGAFVRKEKVANAAITPGDLIELMSTGKIRRHSTIGGQGQIAFALENDLIGKDLNTDYGAGEQCQYGVFESGAEVYAWLTINASCAIGDFLESDGLGKLKASSTPVEGSNIAIALEAVTGGGGVAKRVRIECL